MFNTTIIKESLYATMTGTEVSVSDSTSANPDGGENLLQSPEENVDANADTDADANVDTNMDTNTEGITDGETMDESIDNTNTDVTNVDGESTDIGSEGDGMNTVTDGVNEGLDMSTNGDMMDMSGMDGMNGEITASTTKDPFLSSYVPIIGISAATLAVGVILGILLAKKKIKKGIDLYED